MPRKPPSNLRTRSRIDNSFLSSRLFSVRNFAVSLQPTVNFRDNSSGVSLAEERGREATFPTGEGGTRT